MRSIMSNEKRCWICFTTKDLHRHHIYGAANRKISEATGCWVYLCARHHNMSDEGVHFNPVQDALLKKNCQERFEETHTREEFMRLFGKNYL